MLAQQHLNVARSQAGHAILFYFDINDLKPINDNLGHQAGDAAIKEAAAILKESFRDSDIIGRLGGDEFVALAVNCLDASGGVVSQRLDDRMKAHNDLSDRLFPISMGRGMVRFDPNNPKSLQQLLDEADAKLYVNKRAMKAARGTLPRA